MEDKRPKSTFDLRGFLGALVGGGATLAAVPLLGGMPILVAIPAAIAIGTAGFILCKSPKSRIEEELETFEQKAKRNVERLGKIAEKATRPLGKKYLQSMHENALGCLRYFESETESMESNHERFNFNMDYALLAIERYAKLSNSALARKASHDLDKFEEDYLSELARSFEEMAIKVPQGEIQDMSITGTATLQQLNQYGYLSTSQRTSK